MTNKPPFAGEGARRVRLGDIASVKAGNVAPKKGLFSERGIPFVRAGSLSRLLDGESPRSLERIDKTTADKLGMHLFPEGTILFAKSGMSCMTGNVYVLKEPCYVVSHLACVTIDNTELTLYLKHYFRRNKPNALVENPSFPSIRLGKIKDMEIRLPDARQIARWVSTLERIEGLMETHEHQLSLLDDLVKSRFVEMFGDGSFFNHMPLLACVRAIESGRSPKCESYPRKGTRPGVLKLSGISSGSYLEHENKALPLEEPFLKEKEIAKGDILLARKNTPELVGRCVLVHKTAGNIMFPDIVFRMHPNDNVDGTYLSHLLGGPYLDKVRSLAHGSAKSMSNIPKRELAQMSVPLPPISLQREFAAFASEVDKSRVVVQKQIEKLQTLYDSLAQEYFG